MPLAQEIVDATALSPFSGDATLFAVAAIGLARVSNATAVVGKKKGNWKLWGGIAAAIALASALCLRVVFYQTGASICSFPR